jgi:hypothetical protein
MTPPRFRCLLAEQTAYLYDENAGRLDNPLFEFPLVEDQEVPRLPPEFIVETDAVVGLGARPTFWAGGVAIVPAASLRRPNETRLLVERGDIVAHPDQIRPDRDWRYPVGYSFDPVEDWKRFLDSSVRQGRIGLTTSCLAPVAYGTAAVVMTSVNGFRELLPLLLAVVLMSLAVLSWVRAWPLLLRAKRQIFIGLRARRTLRAAEELPRTEGEPMLMRLWWSAGHGHGPVAVSSLFPIGIGDEETLRVAVIGIERGMLKDDRVPVLVYGRTTLAPIIVVDDVTLWPADRAIRSSTQATAQNHRA